MKLRPRSWGRLLYWRRSIRKLLLSGWTSVRCRTSSERGRESTLRTETWSQRTAANSLRSIIWGAKSILTKLSAMSFKLRKTRQLGLKITRTSQWAAISLAPHPPTFTRTRRSPVREDQSRVNRQLSSQTLILQFWGNPTNKNQSELKNHQMKKVEKLPRRTWGRPSS